MDAKKVIFILVVLIVMVLSLLMMNDADRYVGVNAYLKHIKMVEDNIEDSNSYTDSIEQTWQDIEMKDDSAIRAQLYELRAIRARLNNIDSTIENLITVNTTLLQLWVYILKIQFFILIAIADLVVIVAFCSLLLR